MEINLITSESNDVYTNLSIEKYLFDSYKKKSIVLFFWNNTDSVVIGRNQNPYNECNLIALKKNNVKLARRISGGGAVFHDLGTLNVSVIFQETSKSYDVFLESIIEALKKQDIVATLSGRNDIVIDKKKIAGTAYYRKDDICLFHICILFKKNGTLLNQLLTPNKYKLDKRGIKSVESRVAYLDDFIPGYNQDLFKKDLLEVFKNKFKSAVSVLHIDLQLLPKYYTFFSSDDWIYGKFKSDICFFEKQFPWGLVSIGYKEENGKKKIIQLESDSLDIEFIDIISKLIQMNDLNQKIENLQEIYKFLILQELI